MIADKSDKSNIIANEYDNIEDMFDILTVKLDLISHLGLDDISKDLSYSLSLYMNDIHSFIRAIEVKHNCIIKT